MRGSGDKGVDASGGVGGTSCETDATSESTPGGVEGRDESAIGAGTSFCFAVFVLAAALFVEPLAGVAGREEDAIEGVLVDFRSRPDADIDIVLILVVLDVERGRRALDVDPGRRDWRLDDAA